MTSERWPTPREIDEMTTHDVEKRFADEAPGASFRPTHALFWLEEVRSREARDRDTLMIGLTALVAVMTLAILIPDDRARRSLTTNDKVSAHDASRVDVLDAHARKGADVVEPSTPFVEPGDGLTTARSARTAPAR